MYAANASERRIVMIYDESLEEIWRIKREIASEYASLDDYFKGMLAYQEQERENGVKFLSFPVRERKPAIT